MRNVWRLMVLELRLFVREPMTVVFVLVLPLVMMYVLDGVFGNEARPELYEGLGASTFYAPTYVALSVATIGILFVPVHLAGYREKGVLKRFRASALSVPTVLAGHLALGVVLSLASAAVLAVVALTVLGVEPPVSTPALVAGTVLVSLTFTVLGVVLGLVAPSARAAQGLGVLLFFLFLILGGAGPPREVMPATLVTVGDWLPVTYAGQLLRAQWVEGAWPASSMAVLAALLVLSLVAAGALGRFREV
ncbi:ABC transporter permease [Georgenia sp. H159]|uniref:ABC transporter permease n=1 Tax=Georgenia sp. H159 TaxID=3076115 RepID=UPI002D764A0C|nr:ABC transporter permease [Georgenia sp. H159]